MAGPVLGLDIGGANLKAATNDGLARIAPFELWKNPARLPLALGELLQDTPPFEAVAVTMTGELCDCFETKRQGVQAILDAVAAVAGPKPVYVWLTDGRFVDLATARAQPLLAAASNWLALATFVGRLAPKGPALVIDIGSTTTDIIPLCDGRPVPQGRADPERLRCHELVYTGARRTPLCAILGSGGAAEFFATTLDVFLVLGARPEDPADCQTADGRPATKAAAHARLARMICADAETCTWEEVEKIANRALQRQVYQITTSLEQVAKRLPGPPGTVVLAGAGERLAQVVLKEQKAFPAPSVISLSERIGPAISHAACAYAVAVLAASRTPGAAIV